MRSGDELDPTILVNADGTAQENVPGVYIDADDLTLWAVSAEVEAEMAAAPRAPVPPELQAWFDREHALHDQVDVMIRPHVERLQARQDAGEIDGVEFSVEFDTLYCSAVEQITGEPFVVPPHERGGGGER